MAVCFRIIDYQTRAGLFRIVSVEWHWRFGGDRPSVTPVTSPRIMRKSLLCGDISSWPGIGGFGFTLCAYFLRVCVSTQLRLTTEVTNDIYQLAKTSIATFVYGQPLHPTF
jgi:hypothetical protein